MDEKLIETCPACGLRWVAGPVGCPRCALAAERSNHDRTRGELQRLQVYLETLRETLGEMNELAAEMPPLGSEGGHAPRG